jgi:hypothetical protein
MNLSHWLAPAGFKSHVRVNVPFAEYCHIPGVSKTWLNKFIRNPRKAFQLLSGEQEKPTDAMVLGSIVDALIFPDLNLMPLYHVRPEEVDGEPWQGNRKACKAWTADHSDLPILKASELEEAKLMAAEVMQDWDALDLIRGATPQPSFFAVHEETGLLIKGRPDWLCGRKVADLKTAADASTRALGRAIVDFGYHVQFGLAAIGLTMAGAPIDSAHIIAVEGGEYPQVNVRKFDEVSLKASIEITRRALVKLRQCIDSNTWPGLTRWEGIHAEPSETPEVRIPEHEINRVFDLDNPMSLEGITEVVCGE